MDDHIQDKLKDYESRLYLANEEIVRLRDIVVQVGLIRDDLRTKMDIAYQRIAGDLDVALDEGADDE
jgi:hypothetical protein